MTPEVFDPSMDEILSVYRVLLKHGQMEQTLT